MCPSSFDGGDEKSAVRSQVGVGADGVSHAREDGVSHAREDGDSLAREDGDSIARKDAVNVRSNAEHDGRSDAVNNGVVMIETSALSFSFSCAETRNDVEDD